VADYTKIKKWLESPKDVVILSHRNPDGDAIGSTLALQLFLEQSFHNVKIIYPSEYPKVFSWMPKVEKTLTYDLMPEASLNAIQKAQVIFLLDFNSLERIDKMGDAVKANSCPKIMLDHHLDPEPIADEIISITSASSTSEIVFDFIIGLSGSMKPISIDIANCIYTGIVTDTGSFRYGTHPDLFRKVASLLELGLDDSTIQDLIFNCLEEKYLKLLGYCLWEKMEIIPEYNTGLITLSREDYHKFEIQRGDTEGIVNYLLMLKDIKIAAFITEQPSIVKLSLRSKGDISVQEICRDHFKGGGHKNASGGALYSSLPAVVKKFKEILPQYFKAQKTIS